MDAALSSPQAEPTSLATSPSQPPSDIAALASHAVDSLSFNPPQPHAAPLSSLRASPFLTPSLDDAALMSAQYSELMAQNELLAKENRLFDSFLQRNAAAAIEHEKSPKHSRRDKNRQQIELTLSDLDRNRLAVDELAYRSRQLSSLQHKSTADLALLRSISLNMQLRQQELKKQAFEFQREVVMHTKQHTSAAHPTTTKHSSNDASDDSSGAGDSGGSSSQHSGGGGVTSEVLLRFLAEQVRDKAALQKKLSMKIRHQKATLAHMHAQLRQKEEQGDSLHSIDFHQLQIKNSQYNSRVKDKNEQLLALKSGAGVAVNRLNLMKKILSDELNSNRSIKRAIKQKGDMLERMSSERDKVEAEIRSETAKQSKLQQVQSNPDMPHVMDYVRQKMGYEQLVEADRNWDRKIEIAQMAHVPPNSVRVRQQRRQHQLMAQQQQQQLQGGLRREQEEKEQWRGLNVVASGAPFVSQ